MSTNRFTISAFWGAYEGSKMKVFLLAVVCFFITPNLLAKTLVEKGELKKQIVNQRINGNNEAFYFMPDGSLLYEELDNGEISNGLWFIKQATFNYDSPSPYEDFEPTKKELIGQTVVCVAVKVSAKEEFSWLPCMRLYHEKENLYISHQTQCNLDEPVENGVLHCNWAARTFMYYRISPIEDK
jgi:hypothetical protein